MDRCGVPATDRARRGRFIAFEGIDGSGKSTQAARLVARLDAVGLDVVLTFEPGATSLGGSLRPLLLDPRMPAFSERSEALLLAADRAQHVHEVIRPALDEGAWVVTDRYAASTLAYQGFGRGLDRAGLDVLIDWATAGLVPDVTVLIDLPVEVALGRRRGRADRMEQGGRDFLGRVAEGYRHLAEESGARWLTVDGSAHADTVGAEVWSALNELLGGELERGR